MADVFVPRGGEGGSSGRSGIVGKQIIAVQICGSLSCRLQGQLQRGTGVHEIKTVGLSLGVQLQSPLGLGER